jgi:hypothetical protein
MGGPVGGLIALGTSYLGKKESKNAQNQANDAMRAQGQLAQQGMDPYNQFYNFNGAAPESGMSPWELAIARQYSDATQGYGTQEQALQNSSLREAVDHAYNASVNDLNNRIGQSGFAADPSSGTYMRAMDRLGEQRTLGMQSAGRDLFFANEDLKRNAAGNLSNMAGQIQNLPFQAAGTYGAQGAAAQNQANAIQNQWGSLSNAVGTYIGMQGDGGGGTADDVADVGRGMTPQTMTTQPSANYSPFNPSTWSSRPMATTSLNQPPNLGSMTSSSLNPQQKYKYDPYATNNNKIRNSLYLSNQNF